MVEAVSVIVYSFTSDQKIRLLFNPKTQYRLQQREKLHLFHEKPQRNSQPVALFYKIHCCITLPYKLRSPL